MTTQLSLYRIELPFQKPIKVGAHRLEKRVVGIVRLERDGQLGFGEASPLPGLSQESFDNVSTLENLELPSLKWALEGAQWNMENHPSSSVRLSGLLLTFDDREKALQYEEEGYDVLKIKILAREDFNKLRWICKNTKKIQLRLDFNSVEFNEGENLLQPERIEYVEDPPPSWRKLLRARAIPLAQDVAFHQDIDETSSKLIVKPTPRYRVPFSLTTRQKVVLSSSFESSLGLYQCGLAVHKWNLQGESHGLDTAKYFVEDTFPLARLGGQLSLPSSGDVQDHFEKLTKNLKPVAQRYL